MAPTPAARLAELLATARTTGVPFEQAWPAAVLEAVADEDEWAAWIKAFEATRGAWVAAWERQPVGRLDRALSLVADGSDREPLPERACDRCGAPIPPGRGRRGAPAKYCGDACRRRAAHERVAAAA